MRWSAVMLVVVAFVPQGRAAPPMTGKAVPAFADLDREMLAYVELTRAPAAAVAVRREGELLYSRGFGHRDRAGKTPTPPDAIFRIGSISKPVTVAMVGELARAGKLQTDAKVLDLLKLTPPAGAKMDSRWKQITVDQLIEHKGGWDQERTFDPVFRHALTRRELGLSRPPTTTELTRWMLGKPLDFDPGQRRAYSNFGYCVLGRVIEKAHGKPYAEAMADLVLKPWKIDDIRVGRTALRDRHKREVWYPLRGEGETNMELLDACAGLTASAPALSVFLQHYWLAGPRREEGQTGEFTFFGTLPDVTAMAYQRRDGVDVVVLLNVRRDRSYKEDQDRLLKKVNAAIDKAVKAGNDP